MLEEQKINIQMLIYIVYYMIIKEEAVFKRCIQYLKKYKDILFWTKVNFVAPQIVAFFNNGLYIDLYCANKKEGNDV